MAKPSRLEGGSFAEQIKKRSSFLNFKFGFHKNRKSDKVKPYHSFPRTLAGNRTQI